MNILILGGTGEARALAARLVGLGHEVTTSLAGRTTSPLLPAGKLRVGKFGGIPGLVGYLEARRIDRLVDATHPYAGLISINAVAAAQRIGLPLVRYMRPAWPEPSNAHWRHVVDTAAAAAALPAGATALITTGHEGLAAFLGRDDCSLVIRLIEPPELILPRAARLILARPPYSLAGERSFFEREAITHLVSKNSGGAQTMAKLEAAQQLGIEIIMIERPAYGSALEVASLDAAMEALHLAASG
jgi:precorrin-6A/cobalt-precorrin-6A reductase